MCGSRRSICGLLDDWKTSQLAPLDSETRSSMTEPNATDASAHVRKRAFLNECLPMLLDHHQGNRRLYDLGHDLPEPRSTRNPKLDEVKVSKAFPLLLMQADQQRDCSTRVRSFSGKPTAITSDGRGDR